MLSSSLLSIVCLAVFAALLIRTLFSYLRLRHVPGPRIAAWTNVPRAIWVLRDNAHETHIRLHKKYGSIVRFGPNMVSVQDPTEIRNIYDVAGSFPKSDFYRVLALYAKGRPVPTIFATQDDSLHRQLRKPIAPMYSMTSVTSFEPLVDRAIDLFLEQLNVRYASFNRSCNLGQWLQWLAFDIMGEMTFLKPLGFLERGEDIDGIASNIEHYFRRVSPVSQIPWVDWLWNKNRVVEALSPATGNPIVNFGAARIRERRQKKVSDGESDTRSADTASQANDFLVRSLEVIEKDSSIPPFALTAWTTSNVAAGSDTTAILLRTIFHELLTHADAMSNLLREIEDVTPEPPTLISWKAARSLPYLDAIIKESGRMHPPFWLPYERVVPASGSVVCDIYLPPGTVVGMSAWVVHRDTRVFGGDCDAWRPERWLQCDAAKKRQMENALLTFGSGNRVCLGKNVAYFEIYKIVPSLLKRFKIRQNDPREDWKVKNRWLVNQTGLEVHLEHR